MQYVLDRFAAEIRHALEATGLIDPAAIDLAEPKANVPADLALPCFKGAKQRGVAPPQLAQELATALRFDADSLVGGVQPTGPFLNFTLNRAATTPARAGPW
jgi:arginyl-tRNA synthetase